MSGWLGASVGQCPPSVYPLVWPAQNFFLLIWIFSTDVYSLDNYLYRCGTLLTALCAAFLVVVVVIVVNR